MSMNDIQNIARHCAADIGIADLKVDEYIEEVDDKRFEYDEQFVYQFYVYRDGHKYGTEIAVPKDFDGGVKVGEDMTERAIEGLKQELENV